MDRETPKEPLPISPLADELATQVLRRVVWQMLDWVETRSNGEAFTEHEAVVGNNLVAALIRLYDWQPSGSLPPVLTQFARLDVIQNLLDASADPDLAVTYLAVFGSFGFWLGVLYTMHAGVSDVVEFGQLRLSRAEPQSRLQ